MMKKKDYYGEINKALLEYEEHPYKSWYTKTIEWICNRIDWCYHWKKITEEQMNELVDRIVIVMGEED